MSSLIFIGIAITILIISMNIIPVVSAIEKTTLKLHVMRHSSFNEGQPIVFVGKLTDKVGNGIAGTKVIIKGDAPCPKDHIITSGITDKNGRYWIMTTARIWDEKDNLVKTHAEFDGTDQFLPSKSDIQVIVVYPIRGETVC